MSVCSISTFYGLLAALTHIYIAQINLESRHFTIRGGEWGIHSWHVSCSHSRQPIRIPLNNCHRTSSNFYEIVREYLCARFRRVACRKAEVGWTKCRFFSWQKTKTISITITLLPLFVSQIYFHFRLRTHEMDSPADRLCCQDNR